jgi:hypothetical protein
MNSKNEAVCCETQGGVQAERELLPGIRDELSRGMAVDRSACTRARYMRILRSQLPEAG